MKPDFTEMDGIYLSMSEKSVQSRIVSQCILPKSLFKAYQFAFFNLIFFFVPFYSSHLNLPNGQTYRDLYCG